MTPKIGKIVVADLKKRSKKGLRLAKQILKAEKIGNPTLREALEHYVEYWSDFVHPGLFSIACEAVGGSIDNLRLAQASIAMMAAAFDIHDDILDKSKVKYGIPTVYGKFGAEIALLLGDALLIESFKLFIDSTRMLPKKTIRSALSTIKKLTFEVGNAHVFEVVIKKGREVTPDNYMQVIKMKAAGIELDMHLGALLGGGTTKDVKVLAKLGRIIGILGMLREEFIDIFEVEELSQRIAVQDLPLPIIFAMRDHKAKIKLSSIISKPKITNEDVDELLDIVFESDKIVNLKRKMQCLQRQGLELIKVIHNNEPKNKLETILLFMLEDL